MIGSAFRNALLDPEAPVPAGLVDPEGRPAPRRFAVYRNNVVVGLTGALEIGFPVVRKLVGDEFFAAMAREHLRHAPPRSPLMMFYGIDFPAFLEKFPPVAHLPYLADVARLELAMRDSYHAADAAPMPAAALAGVPAAEVGEARLHLAPSLRLIRSAWPIHGIWSANARDAAPVKTFDAQDVVVLRRDYDPEPHLIPAAAAKFIAAVQAGARIEEAAGMAGPDHDLAATLSLLLAGNGLTGLEIRR